jgi:hypothetical protein
MRRALLLAALALAAAAITTSASASPTRTPSPAAATAALGRFLRQLYGETHGYWTCPGPAIDGRVDCLAEVHTGSRWHQVTVSAWIRHGVIAFTTTTNDAARSWVRRWSPYSRHYIVSTESIPVPGVASVNSPAYDWGWLAGFAERLKDGETRRLAAVDGYDGPGERGLGRFFTFTCSRKDRLISCRNRLGDAMRYRP